MHSTTLSQGKNVLNTVTQTGKQLDELHVLTTAVNDA